MLFVYFSGSAREANCLNDRFEPFKFFEPLATTNHLHVYSRCNQGEGIFNDKKSNCSTLIHPWVRFTLPSSLISRKPDGIKVLRGSRLQGLASWKEDEIISVPT